MNVENYSKCMMKSKVVVEKVYQVKAMLKELNINTVCESARCPNIGECFSKPVVTFIILGNVCSRGCVFCSVGKGEPGGVDFTEPERISCAAQRLGLKHTIITSVARDDLADGGALHFAHTIHELKKEIPQSTIEILAHDFNGNTKAIRTVIEYDPHIFNHTIETVPRIYEKLQLKADYQKSLKILKTVKRIKPHIVTKSGLMVGLGETEKEVLTVMEDLRKVHCDILNIGQYIQPTRDSIPVDSFIAPETFLNYKTIGMEMGFLHVESAPFVRSSYNASTCLTDNLKLNKVRNVKNGTISSYKETATLRI